MAILNHGSTLRTADGGQTTTTIVTAANIGTYGVATNSTYYVGTTQNIFNRASGAQTLTGVSIDGNAANITAYTINQNVGTANAPSFAGMTSTAMLVSSTSMSSNDDWQNSPISVRERGLVSAAQSINAYSPNINFHWASRISNSLWMDANGNLAWGSYSETGVPSSDGAFYAANLYASIYYDKNDTAYYLDPASNSRLLNLGLGNVTPDLRLSVSGDAQLSGILYLGGTAGSYNSWGSRTYTTSGVLYNNSSSVEFNNYGYGSTWTFTLGGGNATSSGAFRAPVFYDSDNTAYYLDAANSTTSLLVAGKVGIGNTSPSAKLHVSGASYTTASAANNNVRFEGGGGNGLGFGTIDATSTYASWIQSGYVPNFATATYALLLNPLGGNVGIGTTTPSQKLDVSGAINASTYVYAGVFYDNDNTVYYTNPSGTSNLVGLTVANTITGSISGSSASCTGNAATATTSALLTSSDVRTISPSSANASRLTYGFTSYSNNNTGSWADYLHLRSYADGTGGNDNLVMFNKNAIGMRIWQQAFGSATAYATYKDVAFTDQGFYIGTTSVAINRSSASQTLTGVSIDGNAATATNGLTTSNYVSYSAFTASLTSTVDARAPIFYDSNNTAYYINPAGNSIVSSLTFDSNITIYKHNDRNLLIQGGGGTDAGLLGRGSSGQFAFQVYGNGSGSYGFLDGAWAGWDIRKVVDGDLFLNDNNTYYLNPASTTNLNNLTVAGDVRSPIFYDSNNTAYYLDPAGTNSLYYIVMPHIANGSPNLVVNNSASENWNAIKINGGNDNNGIGFSNTSHSAFARNNLSFHTHNLDSIRFHSSGWDTLFEVAGSSGNAWLKGGSFDSSFTRLVNPGGAYYVTGTSTITGAIKIRLPRLNANTMMRMTVKIYQYNTGQSATIECGGYDYSGDGVWRNIFAYQNSDLFATVNVRFGNDGTYDCVWIGETSSTWSYPQVFVTDFQAGYNNYTSDWGTGWNISYVTAFNTVTDTRVAYKTLNASNYNSYSPTLTGTGASGTWAISVTGNAATVTNGVYTTGDQTISGIKYFTSTVDPSTVPAGYAGGYLYESTTGFGTYGIIFGSATGQHGAIGYSSNTMYFGTENGTDNTLNTKATLSSGGTFTATGDVRAPIFYDTANTAYYLDPASTSNLNNLTAAGTLTVTNIAKNSTSPIVINSGLSASLGLRVYYDMNLYNTLTFTDSAWNSQGAISGSSGVLNISAANATSNFTKQAGYSEEGGSFRAPIFYDSNNTAYYIDAASTSRLNIVHSNYYIGEITDSGNGDANAPFRFESDYSGWSMIFAGTPGSTNGWGTFWAGNDNPAYYYFGASNPNEYVFVGAGSLKASIDLDNGQSYFATSLRSPIFYDSDNTAYYIDAASGSNLNTVNANRFSAPNNGLISIGDDSATQTYNDGSTRSRLYVSSTYPAITLNSTVTSGNGNHGPTIQFTFNGYDSSRQWVIGSGGTGQQLDFGTAQPSNKNPHEGIAGYSGTTCMRMTVAGNVGIGGSWGYYGTVENPSYRMHVQGTGYASGDFRAPIFYDSANTAYYLDPAAGTSLRIAGAIVGDHAAWTGEQNKIQWHSSHLYFQNTSDGYFIFRKSNGAEPFQLRIGEEAGYATGSWRAPIFYDSNDTAYYLDPRSASVLSGLKLNGIDNDAAGNTSDAILWINKPNNNDWGIRVTGNLEYLLKLEGATSHSYNIQGLANGSEFWRCGTDLLYHNSNIRAPIFYDNNDTAYYVDPASATISSNLKASQAIGRYKTFAINDLSAGSINARTYEIARIAIDYNDWNTIGTFEVELHEQYWSQGLKKVYNIWYGYVNDYGIRLVEWRGSGSNGFQCRIGSPVQVVGDQYYLPIYIDVRNYSIVDVVIKTNRNYTTSSPPAIGYTYINTAPSASNITDFTPDNDLEISTRTTAKLGGNVILTAANYNSYSPTLTGTGASGTWSINVTGNAGGSSASCTGNSATTTLATKATRANGNFYIDDNYGNTVVGLYSATRLQGVFAMGDSYKLTADGTGVGTLYGLAWSHPNFGGVAANLADHGLLILQNGVFKGAWGGGSLRTPGDVRGTLFYDWDNTGYYCDPASTSNLNAITAAGNVTAAQYYTANWFRSTTSGNGLYNEATGQHFYSDSASYWNVASSSSSQGIRLRTGGHAGTVRGYFYADTNNDVGFLNQDGNWRLRVVGGDYSLADGSSMRAQLFYDSNNTGYYVDPASTSNLAGLTVANTISGSITGSAGSVAWTNVSGRPTAVSSFSNDSGYITSGGSISGSSGSCTGNAASVTDGVYLSTNQSISGVKTFSSAPVATNIAKAWVHYNMNNNTINASYNVSSVTDNGTGVCTVNFSTSMVDANYVVAGTATYGYDDQDIYAMILAVPRRSTAQQAGSCRLATEFIHGAQVYDSVAVRAVFYR